MNIKHSALRSFRAIIAAIVLLSMFTITAWAEPADRKVPAPAPPAEAERLEVWNSPSMLAARAWLEDYFRASNRYTKAEAQDYLAKLEQLDADGLRLWLARLDRSMRRTEQDRVSAEADRRYRLARADAVQQQRAINLANLSAVQAERARFAQAQLNNRQRFSESLFLSRTASRDQTLRTQIATQNFRTLQILSLLDRQELRADLRARRVSP